MTKLLMTDAMMQLWKEGVEIGYRTGTGKKLPADVILKMMETKRNDCGTERQEVQSGERNLVVKKPAWLNNY